MAARRWRAAAVVLLASALAAGCGGGNGAGKPTAPSSAPPSTGPATPTDRSPHGVLLAAQLAAHDARRVEFRSSLGGERARGMLFWAPKTVLQLKPEGGTRQLIVLDTSAYLGGDQETATRLGGRHWEKYAGDREVPYAGLIDRLNPLVAATAAAAADDPELVGEEKLQDSTVEHYRVTVGADRYAAAQTQLGPARRQALEQALGSAPVVLDLWLNDKDQPVQIRRSSGGGVDLIGYTEYAGPLSVQAPAEADTADEGDRSLPPAP
ncbi:hypothetical protein ACGFX4_05070 [Kitasatospora sp. NPDC048365]|uniref:hypothetical protein n=1 Tax=Kitasatospora sp. NPDC048365 TaxID=3364050 RepID=UPI003716B404